MRFKGSRAHHRSARGEAASADTGAAASSPEDLAQRIPDGTDTKQQIFHGHETPAAGRLTSLFHSWRGEVSPRLPTSKDRLPLLLGPMLICHGANFRTTLKNWLHLLCLCSTNGTAKPGDSTSVYNMVC